MKKNIINSVYGLALASLMLTACSSAEDATTANVPPTVDETAINFGAYMNRSTTRGGWATELTTATLQGPDAGFGVLAYYTDNQPYTPTALPNFMYNQKVTYNAPDWVYAPLKYWPNEFGQDAISTGIDRLSFFAYAPYIDVDPVTGIATADDDYGVVGLTRGAENGNPKARYFVSFDPAQRVDLCWATPNLNMTKQAINEKVLFEFKHALASINITVDADMDVTGHAVSPLDPNTRIWVRSVTFEGLATKGDLNLNNKEDVPEWYNIYSNDLLVGEPVTIYDGRRDGREGFAEMLNEKPAAINDVLVQIDEYTVDATTDILTGPTMPGVTNNPVNLFKNVTATEPIFVIPTGEPLRITITYDVETYDKKLVSTFLSDTKTHGSTVENTITQVVQAGGGNLTLQAGKQYTIALHLGMTSVKVDASVDPWVTGDDTDTDLPANSNL